MHLKLTKRMVDRMKESELASLGWDRSNIRGLDTVTVALLNKSEDEIRMIRGIMGRLRSMGMRNILPVVEDIDRWLAVLDESDTVGDSYARTLRQFSDLLTEYVRSIPGHRLYGKDDKTGKWLAYYVNFVEYENEKRDYRDKYAFIPAQVRVHLLYWELGGQYREGLTLQNDDVDGMSVRKVLASNDFFAETPELRSSYLWAKARFDEVFEQVGKVYLATGSGESTGDRAYYRQLMPMMSDGVPAKVVLDIVREDGEEKTKSGQADGHVQTHFWSGKRPGPNANIDSDDLAANRRIMGDQTIRDEEADPVEIPQRPTVIVYHLSKHGRYRVNAAELLDYEFDKTMSQQLILPQVTKDLVDVLVSQGRVSFKDIIHGKGMGACILLGGAPGVGKTLTAEVFAEATERPLLSVQAAQLGISPDNIEQNLRAILRKGSRWNAVVLIDEADVYINERGLDLDQNAIVAAFLRILEQHTATIFMTTNHIDRVDDAIISRCLARIDYQMPSVEAQKRIWQVLNRLNDTGLSDYQIDRMVADNPDLSGRDIKQLLKLASLWAESQGSEVDRSTVGFVRQFLPTRSMVGEQASV